MIAKTKLGADFSGALTYGAKQRPRQDENESKLISSYNLLPGSTQQLAQQMKDVAAFNTRCQKSVWHTSLAWPPGEVVSAEQKRQAAERYCELMGAGLDKHQVVVYEHTDTAHAHLHIYINRVPLDGGVALADKNNFYRQTKVCQQISQELNMKPLPERRQSRSTLDPLQAQAQQQVAQTLEQLLREPGRPAGVGPGVEWLTRRLEEASITSRLKVDSKGQLVAVSFGFENKAIKGSQIGFKAAELRQQLQTEPGRSQEQQQQPVKAADKKEPTTKRAKPTRKLR